MFRFREINEDKSITDVITNIETTRYYLEDDNTFCLYFFNSIGDSWIFKVKNKQYLDNVMLCIANNDYVSFNALNMLGYDFDGICDFFQSEIDYLTNLKQENKLKQKQIDEMQERIKFFDFADDLSLKNNK